MERRRVGIITIGQSPRDDIVPDLEAILGPTVQFLQEGALDGLDDKAVRALEPRGKETVLATRLRNGREVRIGHASVVPLLADAIQRACNAGAESAVLLCTGTFDGATLGGAAIPIITADQALIHTGTVLASGRNLLVVCPDARQVPEMEARWSEVAPRVIVVAASPYDSRDKFRSVLRSAASTLGLKPDEWLAILDCVGYDLEHRRDVRQSLNLSAVVARLTIGHLVAQLQ